MSSPVLGRCHFGEPKDRERYEYPRHEIESGDDEWANQEPGRKPKREWVGVMLALLDVQNPGEGGVDEQHHPDEDVEIRDLVAECEYIRQGKQCSNGERVFGYGIADTQSGGGVDVGEVLVEIIDDRAFVKPQDQQHECS